MCSVLYTQVGSCHMWCCVSMQWCVYWGSFTEHGLQRSTCQTSVLTQLWRTSALCRACLCDRWFSEQEVVYCICTAGIQFTGKTARLWRPHTVTQLQIINAELLTRNRCIVQC